MVIHGDKPIWYNMAKEKIRRTKDENLIAMLNMACDEYDQDTKWIGYRGKIEHNIRTNPLMDDTTREWLSACLVEIDRQRERIAELEKAL